MATYITCISCHTDFDKTIYGGTKYCPRCRSSTAPSRERDKRRRNLDYTPDNTNFLGEHVGSIRWVRVVKCPKDDPSDPLPMFIPKVSKFPFDQFLTGLKDGIWPVGMVVDVRFLRYGQGKNGKRTRHEKLIQYTVPPEQKELIWKLEGDQRRFMKEAKKYLDNIGKWR